MLIDWVSVAELSLLYPSRHQLAVYLHLMPPYGIVHITLDAHDLPRFTLLLFELVWPNSRILQWKLH